MCANYFAPIIKNSIFVKCGYFCIRNYCRNVLGEKIVPLTENTVLGRMMVYLNNVNKTGSSIQVDGTSTIENLIHGKTNNLHKLNVDQIVNLFHTANISILSHSKQNLRKVLGMLDVECCLRLTNMEPNNILKLLSAYMHVVPNRITEYKFYHYATDDIDRCLKLCSKSELVQFVFYIGLQKKNKKAQAILRKCLRTFNKQFLESLTVEDLCIICNSTYRTNTKITNWHLLEKAKQTLNENLSLLKDPALLSTLIKTIKQNRYQDEDLLTTISCTVFFNKTIHYYSFTTISHLCSLYSDYLYLDEELFNLFINQSIKQLQETNVKSHKTTYLSEQMRTKDIAVFLRSVSTLNCSNFDKNALERSVATNLSERLALGEFKNDLSPLIEPLLCMWMLNSRLFKLIHSTLTKQTVNHMKQINPKIIPNLNLLLSVIEHEDPSLFKDLHVKADTSLFNPAPQIKSRPLLQKLCDAALKSINIDHAVIKCQIPHLNTLGIAGYTNGKHAVNVELLDEFTCVKNKDCHPNGFMQLKLRILEQSDVPLIIVRESEVASLDATELQQYLKDEIFLTGE